MRKHLDSWGGPSKMGALQLSSFFLALRAPRMHDNQRFYKITEKNFAFLKESILASEYVCKTILAYLKPG